MNPLSHHEIMGIIGPFARRGRRVDMEKTDRAGRRVVFRPVEHAAMLPQQETLTETMLLENTAPATYRLTRIVTLGDGLQAALSAEGQNPASLLERVESVLPQKHFRVVAQAVIAVSYRIEECANTVQRSGPVTRLVFARGQAHIQGLLLTLEEASARGHAATITLEAPNGDIGDLPTDILAVLGWEWGLLRRRAACWKANLRFGSKDRGQIGRIEEKLDRMVAHLADVLAKPPSDFHDALLRARWGVTLRRAMPLISLSALIVGAFGLRYITVVPEAFLRFLSMGLPPALLVAGFSMRERPPLEIPPLPRRLPNAEWR